MSVAIIDKTSCTGCGCCANICPESCISMEPDACGFLYPVIDSSKCIACDICVSACPVENRGKITESTLRPDVYAAWSNNPETRYTSTSGGAFSELALSVVRRNGVVCGAAYDRNNLVEHLIIDGEKGIERVRQSKYVQSDTRDVYCRIRDLLLAGRPVLFCGTPCQVAALKSFLGKEYDGLRTIDFICRGVNSPKAYSAWLDQLESNHSGKVTRVWFKYKAYGWKKSPRCTRVDFENGESVILNAESNTFMKGYLDCNLYLRPSCADCRFKGVERSSDITLADFWRISGELDDDKGTSMLMINTPAGRQLLEQTMDRLTAALRPFEEIAAGNACFDGSVKINNNSEKFLSSLDSLPFDDAIKEYLRVPLTEKVRRIIRRTVNKVRRMLTAFPGHGAD